MRRLLILAALVAACGPTINNGTVSSTRFVAAHEYTWLMPVYAGQTCTSTGGKKPSRVCTPRYTYIPRTEHVPDACYVTLTDGENNYTEHGVPCAQFSSYAVGQHLTFK